MATSFLDLARLESGRASFEFKSVNMGELLEECAGVTRLKTNELGLTFNVEIPDKMPPMKVDRDKIKQVVLNLLSNAHKFNRPKGSITLSAKAKLEEVIIVVTDTGWGMSEEEIPFIFEKFYRTTGSDQVTSGTGLGLSIAKRIVDTHGGEINVKSKLGEGTTFTVHLPYSPS
jgi:two-component system sensor histidine kinase ResE